MFIRNSRLQSFFFAFRAPEGGATGAATTPPATDAPEGESRKVVDVDMLGGALKGQRERISKDVKKQIDDALAPVLERMTAPTPPADAGKKDDRVAQLEKQVESERKARQAMEEKLADRERRARDLKRDSMMESHLEAAGMTNQALRDGAAAMLLKRGFVRVDHENDAIEFVDIDEFGNERVMELGAGIKKWARSDAAKPFIPARGTGGSGERRSPKASSGGGGGGNGANGNGLASTPPTDPKQLAEWQAARARMALRRSIAGHLGFESTDEDE